MKISEQHVRDWRQCCWPGTPGKPCRAEARPTRFVRGEIDEILPYCARHARKKQGLGWEMARLTAEEALVHEIMAR